MEKGKDEWWRWPLGLLCLLVFGQAVVGYVEKFRIRNFPKDAETNTPSTVSDAETNTPSTVSDTETNTRSTASLKNLMLGQAADFDGLKITVLDGRKETVSVGDKPTFLVQVKYENSRGEAVSYREYDWKLEDPYGARTQQLAYSGTLGLGELAPGGMRVGTIRFTTAEEVKKVVFNGGSSVTGDQFHGENGIATWQLK